jgi:hypothetical protein
MTCSSTKNLDSSNHKNIHVKYIDKELTPESINEVSLFFKSLNEGGDTLIGNNSLNGFDKLSSFVSENPQHYDYYFFKDSVRVDNPFSSYIYIPSTREKFSSEIYLNGERKFQKKRVFEEYRTTEEIRVSKKNKKTINGIKCYLIEVKKTQKIGNSENIKILTIYLSDKFDISLNHYDLVNLSTETELNGLIMELKISDEFDNILKHFKALEVNTDLLNYQLIDVKNLEGL